MTLDEARADFQSQLGNGVSCPCCNRFSKRYKRKLTGSMIRCLLAVHYYTERHKPADGWVHVTQELGHLFSISAEYSKLRYWGLLERRPGEDDGIGYWRVTDKGRQFIAGAVAVPKYALIFNSELIGHSGEEVSRDDVYRERFDFNELMAAA